MQVADVEMVRSVRRELGRHQLDISEATVSAMHGVIHLTGRVRPLKGHEGDFEQELHNVSKVLRRLHEVRDVVMEWQLPDGYKAVTRPGSHL